MVFVLLLSTPFIRDPLPSFNWWAVSVGGEELKWRQLAHHHLMRQQGPQFSPHSKAKANDKSKNLRKNCSLSDVAFVSVYSEKARLKKCLIMIIVYDYYE